jgi:hypothetical protein
MYEFLVRTISRALLDDDKRRQAISLRILKRHFKPGSELFREFRIANALYKSTVSSPAVAASIMQEAKVAVKALDGARLEREKSILIREVNHNLQDPTFYDQSIKDYKVLATIQTLFDEWREPTDIALLAEYEDKVNQWLVTNKQIAESIDTDADPGTVRLVSRIMTQRLNEKYSDALNEDQKALVRAYALSEAVGSSDTIRQHLESVRTRLLQQIREHESAAGGDREKINEVKQMLLDENITTIDDDTVTRFMLYSKLCADLALSEVQNAKV